MQNKIKSMQGDEKPMQIIEKYAVHGVPWSMLGRMCEELNVNEDDLKHWLSGQTCGLMGEEPLVYTWDIERFISGKPVID